MELTEKVKQFAKEHLDEIRWWHTQDVATMALKIAEKEGADKEVVEIAAWLHDVGSCQPGVDFIDHHEVSVKLANKLLCDIDYPQEKKERVLRVIREHMPNPRKANIALLLTKSGKDDSYLPRPSSIESKVLFDADGINACGPWGITKTMYLGGKDNKNIKELVKFALMVQETVNDLETRTGKEMVRVPYGVAKSFLELLN